MLPSNQQIRDAENLRTGYPKTVRVFAMVIAYHPYGVNAIIVNVAWEVEFTDEFEEWWHTLSESEQGKVDARVKLLMERGPNLGFPFSSQVQTSRFPECASCGPGRRRPIADVVCLRSSTDRDSAARR